MLGPSSENENSARDALSAYPHGLQIGGGIDETNAMKWIECGAESVIVTSWVFRDGTIDMERLERLSKKVGKERLVLDLSCRRKPNHPPDTQNQVKTETKESAIPSYDSSSHPPPSSSSTSSSSSSSSSSSDLTYYVVTDRWQRFTCYPVSSSTLIFLSSYCSEFLVHGVDVEGKQSGIELDLISILSSSPIPVTYAGGVRSLDDIEKVWELGKGKVNVSVGSALDLFGGKLPYEEVKKKCEELRNRGRKEEQRG